MDSDQVFGFLPTSVLQNVNELGNWKTRSHAIEQVQHGLATLGPAQTQVLLQQLPEFVAFLQQLLQDHNFKVVTAGLDVLANAARSLGTGLQPHLGDLVPVLVSRLSDRRGPVAAAALRSAAMLMQHTQPNNPASLVNKLMQLQLQQQQVTSAASASRQDCSGLLELIILALLKCQITSLDLPAAARLLLASWQLSPTTEDSSSSPSTGKQQALALEALALATDSLGAQLPNVLKQAGGSDLEVAQVLTQVQQLQRPLLAADGSVRHNAAVQAAVAAAAAAPSASAGFLIGAGLYDRTGSSNFRSDSSFKASKSTGVGSKNGLELDAMEDRTAGALSRPYSGMQEQMLPPGSLGALASHARLISSAASSIAAAAEAGGSSGGSRPASGRNPGRSQASSQGLEGRYCNVLQVTAGSSSTNYGTEHTYTAGRSPLGSPRAWPNSSHNISSCLGHGSTNLQAAGDTAGQYDRPGSQARQLKQTHTNSCSSSHGSMHGTEQQHRSGSATLEQQHLSTQLSKLQLYDSGRYAPHRQDSQPAQDAAASVEAAASERRSDVGDQGDGGTASSFGKLPAGQAAGVSGDVRATHNLRYQQSSSNPSPRRETADQTCTGLDAALQRPPQLDLAASISAGGTNSSSWLGASGPGWAPSEATSIDAASSPCFSGRVETLSPSRGERLANLKRRQVEKRAVSATGSTRGSFPWDSQEGALAAAAAAAGSAAMADAIPRAATAGPAPANGLGWRFSSTPDGLVAGGAGCSSSLSASAEQGFEQAGHSRVAPLLQWHIPTGPGGRVMPPGAASSAQHARQHGNSPEPAGAAVRTLQGSYSPSASWDSSSATAARTLHSSTGGVPATDSSSAGQLLQYAQRTVSAAAVLTGGGAGKSSPADSSGYSSAGAAQQCRSSRFQQPRSGSSSPASTDGGSLGGPAGPLAASRLHQSGSSNSTAGSGSSNRQQRQHKQQQCNGNARAQTAAPVLGSDYAGSASSGCGYSQTAALAAEWGTGTSSSPASRLGSACGFPSSGCFSNAGASLAGGGGSPMRSRVSSGLRGTPAGERPQSVGSADVDLASAELAPLPDPEAAVRQVVTRLQQANTATRKELDWQAQLDALLAARRLLSHHSEVLRPSARELVLAALPSVDDLRSTTSRMAMLFFQELPASGLGLERELDELVLVLLKKAGDLSTAGRDNFLAQEADKALSLTCAAVSESRALSALIAAGAGHKSPHVRSRAAAHLDGVAAGGQGLEALLRSGNWAVLDKLFKTAAAFLQEGSLDTRTYGKRLLWAVKTVLRGNRPDMDRLMSGITPEGVHTRVVEVLKGLSAPPPPPVNRGTSSAGPRLASRGQSSACSTPTSGSLSGIQPAPPFSAPPASLYNITSTVGQDGAHNASRPGYSSIGSTNGGSSAARRALFSGGGATSSNAPAGLQVQGAGAGAGGGGGCMSPGSPDSPVLSSNASRRRRSTACGLSDDNRNPPGSPSVSGSGSPGVCGLGSGPLSGAGAVSGNERRMSGGCPSGPPGPMSPELQEAVDQVGLQLCSKDWRNRMDALRALSALGPALPEVPNAPLDGLLQALIGRLSDSNAKVNQKALEVLCEVVQTVHLRTLLVMPSLMPALTANLGSTNDKLRSCASTALDAVAAAVSSQPHLLMQGLAQAVANGSVRTRVAVIDKLGVYLPAVHSAQPQLTRLLLPAAFALALEARGELRAAAAQLLSSLVSLLGPCVVTSAAAMISSATEQRVREVMLWSGARS